MSLTIEIIGYVGVILNSLAALPQINKVYITEDVSSLSIMFLLCWCVGCLLLMIYNLYIGYSLVIFISYLINVIAPCILIVLYIKYRK